MALPYQNATSGNNAINDIQKMLRHAQEEMLDAAVYLQRLISDEESQCATERDRLLLALRTIKDGAGNPEFVFTTSRDVLAEFEKKDGANATTAMTIAEMYAARSKYRCDICGAEDFWRSTWSRMTSIAHDEACPGEVPTVCSDKCKAELDARLNDGRIALPRLKITAAGAVVVKKRHGY